MTTTVIGTGFAANSDWHEDEQALIKLIHQQIDRTFSQDNNLLINSTWFGPQFDNGLWQKYKSHVVQHRYQRVFIVAAADPVFLNHGQLSAIQEETNSTLYLIGHFDGPYYFNFHSQVLPKYFVRYSTAQLHMREPQYLYANYNRKPRNHRCALVNYLIQQNMLVRGIVTLGKQHDIYSDQVQPGQHLSLGETAEDAVGNWGFDMGFGIPHDIHSLGRLDIWQNHFLNIVGETEFFPWDNMFISEKTWKPILGLRPFVINGQQKIYQYLRDEGFKTFNHYWPHIDIESGDVCETIVQLVNYLSQLSADQIQSMYQDMIPDLLHNRRHFYVYAQQQKHKISNLFAV